MARAMKLAVEAGRLAFEAGRMPKKLYASASSPLAGVVGSYVLLFRFAGKRPGARSSSVKVYESKDIRNVGVVGHGDSGKTYAHRRVAVHRRAPPTGCCASMKATPSPILTKRKSPAKSLSPPPSPWRSGRKAKINILDTPGYNIFINDTRAALVAADSALVLVDGVAGVEVQTEKVWELRQRFQAAPRHRHQQAGPRARRFRARPRERAGAFGRAAVPIQIPIGASAISRAWSTWSA
jgi:elongation factor G